jgi:hypothetical protein
MFNVFVDTGVAAALKKDATRTKIQRMKKNPKRIDVVQKTANVKSARRKELDQRNAKN